MTENINQAEILAIAEKAKHEREKKISEKLVGYHMRELTGEDIFLVLDIANRLNLADMVLEFMEKRDEASIKQQQALGFAEIASESEDVNKVKEMQEKIAKIQSDVSKNSFAYIGKAVKLVLNNLNTIRPALNDLLANLTGKTVDEIERTNIVTYTLLIKAFFSKPELKELLELLF